MSWDLSVSSKQMVSGWEAEATRLHRFLGIITEQVATRRAQPLRWRNRSMAVEQWNDPAEITAEILKERLRNEDAEQSLTPGGMSTGTVQGYLGDSASVFVHSMWSVGGDREWQFITRQNFSAEADALTEELRSPLNAYPVEWLVGLLRTTAECVDADEARIDSMGIFKAMKKAKVPREIRRLLGAVTLVPHGITNATLPGSVTVHPGIDTKPDSVILTVDLDAAVNNPAAIIDELLAIHAAMKPRPAT